MPKFVPKPRKQKDKFLARNSKGGDVDQKATPATEPAVSSKKAKRLEKYIQNKLKKDENRELLAKLAASKIDTSLFESSRNLGQTKGKRRARHALDRPVVVDDASSEEGEERRETDRQRPVIGAATGSGLKRRLEVDGDAHPVIQKRRKRGGVKSKFQLHPVNQVESESDELQGLSDDDDDGDDDAHPVTQKRQGPGIKSKSHPDNQVESESDEFHGFSDDDDSEPGQAEGEEASEVLEKGEDSEDDEGSTANEISDSVGGSGSDGSSDDDSSSDNDETAPQQPSAFKAWAHAQRNAALGYEPASLTATAVPAIPNPERFKPRPVEQDPLPSELEPSKEVHRKAYHVVVNRTPELQSDRLKLPIVAEEQKIMEAIHNFDVVVISGATGSGKTTQVPQFLYEAGYGSPDSETPGMIGITQPRRVAAVSMAKRVAQEMGDQKEAVAYQIRFEGTTDRKTVIKFMTDGVLMREMIRDFGLQKYAAVIVDEAHERSINTDVLIGLLSRVNKFRRAMTEKGNASIKPLKIVIMSATLRIQDITENAHVFPTPPRVIEVEGRQFPVTNHFARRTDGNYMEELFQKISKGHRKLPPGGFLVFLTGQEEIHQLAERLKKAFAGTGYSRGPEVRLSGTEVPYETEDIDFGITAYGDDYDRYNGDISSIEDDGDDAEEFAIEDEEPETGPMRMNILPLYSLLSIREQQNVFLPPPDGCRQVILATNIAETSLTIPGIRYVFDCGRAKERKYHAVSGIQRFEIGFISKASANQRSGRAGRTMAGHCYRLYSSAVYERHFPEFAEPEILRTPLEGVVLQLHSIQVPDIPNFPFPTPPDKQSLVKAEKLLKYMSALRPNGQLTTLGMLFSNFPLAPRFSRILLLGNTHGCLPYAIAMVAAMSVREILIPLHRVTQGLNEEERLGKTTEHKRINKLFCFLDDKSDAIKILQVIGEFAHEPTRKWCEDRFVRYRALTEAQQIRRQLVGLLRSHVKELANLTFQDKLDKPTPTQLGLLKQMVVAGFLDQVAIRGDKLSSPPEQFSRAPSRAIDVPYVPLFPINDAGHVTAADKMVFIHGSSPLAHLSVRECPDFIVYSQLSKSDTGKTRMHALTDVTGRQLASLAKGTPLIRYGKPVKEVMEGITERTIWVHPYLRADGEGGEGWELPLTKIKEKKVPGQGWVVQ